MSPDLLGATAPAPDLDQHWTPYWAADRLISLFFGYLTTDDVVVEPACGVGAFLAALPEHIPAVGVEIDPAVAAAARIRTGRTIITGDFRTAPIAVKPTAIIGNPPFNMTMIDAFLTRAHQLLPRAGRAGFILPAYAFQTASRINRYVADWSIEHHAIPKDIFPRLSKPLCFAIFSKDRRRLLTGLVLYPEAQDARSSPYSDELGQSPTSSWRAAVTTALRNLGGEAELRHLYAELAPRRPSDNVWWRDKVRQICHLHFDRTGPARYRLPVRAQPAA